MNLSYLPGVDGLVGVARNKNDNSEVSRSNAFPSGINSAGVFCLFMPNGAPLLTDGVYARKTEFISTSAIPVEQGVAIPRHSQVP